MTSRRRTLLVLAVFVVVCAIVGSGSLVAIRSADLATRLLDVAQTGRALQQHAQAGDLQAVSDDLVELETRADTALAAAGDPVLVAADGLPVAGGYLTAARSAAQAVAGLASAAQPLGRLLPDLAPDRLVVDGRYDTATLAKLGDAVDPLSSQLAIATRQLAGIDTSGLDSRVGSAIVAVRDGLQSASHLFSSVRPLLDLLPLVIGEDGTWFVGLQNLDEARGSGGILSAYSIITVQSGRISLDTAGSDTQLVADGFHGTDGLPDDFLNAWSGYMGDWRDINAGGHFPYTGELIRNGWKSYSGQSVDGVLTFGQGIVQYLLAATGPVTVQGQTLDASTVTQFLSLGLYEKFPSLDDKGAKDAFIDEFVGTLFARIGQGQFSIADLVSATSTVDTGDRAQAWSPDEAMQARIVDAGLAGEIPTTSGPTAAVVINNAGANKLEQFLHTSIDYALGACGTDDSGGTTYDRASTITVTLDNEAPTSGLPAYVTPRGDIVEGQKQPPVGSNNDWVTIYLPVGATEGDYTLDGQPAFAAGATDRGRTVLTFIVELNPGQTRELVLHMTEPTVGAQVTDILGSRPSVLTQPSLNPIAVTAKPAEPCDVSR